MRFTSLTALFFAFFSVFCTLAYAAPLPLEGSVAKRDCTYSACRNTGSSSDSSSGTNPILAAAVNLLNYYMSGNSGSQPGAPPAFVSPSASATPTPTPSST